MASRASSEPITDVPFASRLIPGSATTRKNRWYQQADDTARLRVTDSDVVLGPRQLERVRDLCLPSPMMMGGERYTLFAAVVVDYLTILANWFVVTLFYMSASRPNLAWSPSRDLLLMVLRSAEIRCGLAFAVVATLLGYSEGLYRSVSLRNESRDAARVIKAAGWSALLVWIILGFAQQSLDRILVFLLATCLSTESLLIVRRFREGKQETNVQSSARNVLIVGSGPVARALATQIAEHPEMGRKFRGFLDDVGLPSFGVLGSPKDLARIARAEFADEIILAVPGQREVNQMVIREARHNHLDVKLVPDLFGLGSEEPWLEAIGGIPMVTLHREKLPAVQLCIKRVLDLVGAAAALILSAPILAVVAALIRIDSRGPVFYRAERVGRKGKRFVCCKFRTMESGANDRRDELRKQNERDGPCFKLVKDPRVTHIGRWLRRYSVDELPQLWNVLRGDMSLVGPRPHPVDDVARYELNHLRRLDVTPGMTGLWQVTARQKRSFRTNMELDLEYIERWSLRMDISILLKTLQVVVRGTGV